MCLFLSVVRLPFVDGLDSFLFIASVRLGYFVCHGGAGIVVEDHEDGKVVGPDVGKATQLDEKEMPGCEDVIQRIAQKAASGVKGVE
jgi:hypothetical protein